MNLSEIKKSIEKGDKIESLNIEVKPYLSIVEKMMMVLGYEKDTHQNGIVDDCIELKNYFAIMNYFLKEITIKISIINWYTNIEIDGNDNVASFDYIMTSGIWEYVINKINKDEYEALLVLIENSLIERVKSFNSFEAIINRNLNKIVDKLPNDKQIKSLVKSLIKDLKNLDVSKFSILQDLKGGRQ